MSDVIFPVTFQKIIQANQYTTFVLEAKQKQFAIYTTPAIGEFVERLFSDTPSQRPQTLDLIRSLFTGLDVIPLQLIIHDMSDAIYFCKLFVTQTGPAEQKILELDARPSDALPLALMYNAPIYCTQELLDKSLEYVD